MKLVVVDRERVALAEPVGGCLDMQCLQYLDGKHEEEIVTASSNRVVEDTHVLHTDIHGFQRVACVQRVTSHALHLRYDYGERETVEVALPTQSLRFCKKEIRRPAASLETVDWIPVAIATSVACAVIAPLFVGSAAAPGLMGAAKITNGLSKLGGGMNMGLRVMTGVAAGAGALVATLWNNTKRKRDE